MRYTSLNEAQHAQLLKPLNPTRVKTRSVSGSAMSYLETWDVRAMMIRIFGFGGWSFDVQSADLAFEGEKDGKWNVGYKVIGKLRIEELYCTYTEAAVGFSTQGSRGEAHDMAIKTAESDAFKRCCVNLGTQFGLSLYDNGATRDVVIATLVAQPNDQEAATTVEAVKKLLAPLAPTDITDETNA
jgi:recombination DNA repair RAD52 pathway protein